MSRVLKMNGLVAVACVDYGGLILAGARREELLGANVAQIQQVRDLLECMWPAVLTTAAQPFRSTRGLRVFYAAERASSHGHDVNETSGR
jgi:hypothetical protein